mmetsp:Transcript_104716/g.233747  ORF Transcript_104716/g.233747 Transcript_104716/m.233747 type:complete len:219 (+) Transcript_104716:197-853(+)
MQTKPWGAIHCLSDLLRTAQKRAQPSSAIAATIWLQFCGFARNVPSSSCTMLATLLGSLSGRKSRPEGSQTKCLGGFAPLSIVSENSISSSCRLCMSFVFIAILPSQSLNSTTRAPAFSQLVFTATTASCVPPTRKLPNSDSSLHAKHCPISQTEPGTVISLTFLHKFINPSLLMPLTYILFALNCCGSTVSPISCTYFCLITKPSSKVTTPAAQSAA